MVWEPININFTVESKPWTTEELHDFRKLTNEIKAKNAKKKLSVNKIRGKVIA